MSMRHRPYRRQSGAGSCEPARRGLRAVAARARNAIDALAVRAAPALRAARGFGAARVQLRAAALTYLTVVSLVPFLTVILYGLQALDVFEVTDAVRNFVYDNLAVGSREAIEPHLEKLISNAARNRTVGIGFLVLIGSAVLLLRNVEKAFDDLWAAERRRPFSRQLPRYLGVLIIGPLALALSLGVTTAFRAALEFFRIPAAASFLGALVPFLLSLLGFTVLYLLAPPSKVRARAAFGGAAVAAVAWEAAKLVYTVYATRAVTVDIIYGPLAALPLFLVWIYVSWMITLFGARVAFALQHPREILAGDDRDEARELETAAVLVAVALARTGTADERPTLHDLARTLALPEETVRTAVGYLEAAELVEVVGRHVALTRPPAAIDLRDVVRSVRGELRRPPEPNAPGALAAALLGRADEVALSSLSGHDLASLAVTSGPPDSPEAGPPLAKA